MIQMLSEARLGDQCRRQDGVKEMTSPLLFGLDQIWGPAALDPGVDLGWEESL